MGYGGRCVGLALFWSALLLAGCPSSSVKAPPPKPDPTAEYLFFMHGSGLFKANSDRAYGKWRQKVAAFDREGFVVISERRTDSLYDHTYAKTVRDQVNALIAQGVPEENITVSGFSRGARLSLYTAELLQNPNIKFVLLSGCFESDEVGDQVAGKFLSLYNIRDADGFGSCASRLEGRPNVEFTEIRFDSPTGHQQFAVTRRGSDDWLRPVVDWIRAEPR